MRNGQNSVASAQITIDCAWIHLWNIVLVNSIWFAKKQAEKIHEHWAANESMIIIIKFYEIENCLIEFRCFLLWLLTLSAMVTDACWFHTEIKWQNWFSIVETVIGLPNGNRLRRINIQTAKTLLAAARVPKSVSFVLNVFSYSASRHSTVTCAQCIQ